METTIMGYRGIMGYIFWSGAQDETKAGSSAERKTWVLSPKM